MKCKAIVSASLFALLLMTGCGNKPLITGEVFDGFGAPLKDTVVAIESTTFKTTTDAGGKYSVEYVPGKVRLRITKDGYTAADASFDIAAASTYPAQRVTLYKIPPQRGLFLFAQSDYVQIARGRVNQQLKKTEVSLMDPNFYSLMATYGGDKHEDLFSAIGGFTDVPAGTKIRFLAKDEQKSDSQPLFKLNDDGLILTREYFVSSHKDKYQTLSYEEKQLGNGTVLREVTLERGRYAFVTLANDVKQGRDSLGSGVSFGRSNPLADPIYLFEVK